MTTPADRDEDAPTPVRIEVHVEGSAQGYAAGRDMYITHAAPAAPAPVIAVRTLPRDVAAFTGRESEMDQILAATQPAGVVVIHTIDGMPGVGKTALAVHAAHRLASRYPDGQLFLRLNAHAPGQRLTDSTEALADLLLSLGVDPRNIPDGLEARAGLWRDRLTGRRMLLVLDDAADHAQIEPLLPGSEGCLVLVTSRHRLLALDGATPLSLETLPPQDAALLFTRLAHRDTTTATDTESVGRIVELCGRLPLAIALLAGRVAHHPNWNLTDYAKEFAAAQDRLDELAAGDRAVKAAFDLSYQALPPQRQRLFRCLGLHPGPDTDTYATAALVGTPFTQARSELEALYTDHLIDSPTTGRYRLHDLIRTYAHILTTGQDPADDRQQAFERLVEYYQHTAEAADRHLNRFIRPGTPSPAPSLAYPPHVATRGQALSWMRAERSNLLACADHAVTSAQPSHLVRLAAAMASFFRHEGYWDQAAALHQAAVTAADQGGDRIGVANALWDLGHVRRLMGEYPVAVDLLEQALTLYRGLGNRHGEANALTDLGLVRHRQGEYSVAVDLLEQALTLSRDLNDLHGEIRVIQDLGYARFHLGEYSAAVDLLEHALTLSRDFKDRVGEASILQILGHVRRQGGDHSLAVDLLEQVLVVYRSLDDRPGQAYALTDLGHVKYLTGELPVAAQLLENALALFRDLNDRLGEANTLWGLGLVRHLAGDFPAAVELMERALALCRLLGHRQGETEVLNSMGALFAESAEAQYGLTYYRQACQLAKQMQNPLEEAKALEGTARSLVRIGNWNAALTTLHEAVSIYRRIDAPEATSAAEHLAQLQARHPEKNPVQESTES